MCIELFKIGVQISVKKGWNESQFAWFCDFYPYLWKSEAKTRKGRAFYGSLVEIKNG